MKRFFHFIVFAAAAIALSACGRGAAVSLEDFSARLYTPVYASGFEIVGAEGMRSAILKTKNPWQGAERSETMLLIVRDGETVPEGFAGQVLEGDAERIVCMSSTYVAMLDAVGETRRVVGVSGLGNISNEYVAAHRGTIGDVGFDGNVDYERLVALGPDLVLLFGVNGASGMEAKLRELGIPFAYVGEYLEESPLGKAEWLVAVSELIGKRTDGEKRFAAIPERYDALREKVAGLPADGNPKVMINTPYGGSWFMASASSYVARLIADAGGDYIYKKNASNRSLPIDLEEAYLLTAQADVWLNVGSASTLGELKTQYPKFADTRCVRRGAVYNCNKRVNAAGGNDYWESGVVHPELVLQDLIAILHPEALAEEDRTLYYYKRLE